MANRIISHATKQKMSVAKIGIPLPHTTEWNAKISESHKGKIFSEQSKQKLKEYALLPENIERSRNAAKKNWERAEYRQKMANVNANNKIRPVVSQKAKNRLKNPEALRKQLSFAKPNKTELLILDILKTVEDEWHFTGDGSLVINGKCPDFCNGDNLLIEYNGAFFHQNDCRLCRIEHFLEYGYHCLIIEEYELKDIERLQNKIEYYIAEHKNSICFCNIQYHRCVA